MAVGERDIGLDVVDGRTVAQVGAENVDDGAFFRQLDTLELDAGEADGIRPERTARRKDAYTLRAAQTRRSHRARPVVVSSALVLGRGIACDIRRCSARRPILEPPDQPQVGEGIEPRNGGIARELGLEDDPPLEMGRQKAVARNAELLRQVGMDMRDRFHGQHCNVNRGRTPVHVAAFIADRSTGHLRR